MFQPRQMDPESAQHVAAYSVPGQHQGTAGVTGIALEDQHDQARMDEPFMQAALAGPPVTVTQPTAAIGRHRQAGHETRTATTPVTLPMISERKERQKDICYLSRGIESTIQHRSQSKHMTGNDASQQQSGRLRFCD